MAVQFQSSQRRAFWAAVVFSFAADYLIVFVILWLTGIHAGTPLWALLWTLGIQIAVALYALLGLCKRLVWYYLFEREQRISATASDIQRLGLPAPEPLYNDVDDYLHKAANSDRTPDEGRLFAGMILGAMAVQRMIGPRVEAFLTAMTIEAALQRVPQKTVEDEELEYR